MLTTAEASAAVADATPDLGTERVTLARAAGRVLRQAVQAERDQPPFDRVTMDGIAIRHETLADGTRGFRISGTQHAGDAVLALSDAGGCIEVMTGAALPIGTDCVIPVERIRIANGNAELEKDYAPALRQFVHPRGSDYRSEQVLLKPGRRLTPMDIAIVASCGLTDVDVARMPRICVVSTGNELVPPGEPIQDHQIRMSNGPALVAMLSGAGFGDVACEHVADDEAALTARLAALLDACDLLILSGGVSMGKADFVPGVLADLGVRQVFHKVSQRPGKPLWFGKGRNDQLVFGLPGNPVSTLVCCRQYVLPALAQAAGAATLPEMTAVLSEDVTFNPALTCFLPVRTAMSDDGRVGATPVPTNTSGDFAALSGTDGYVELDRDRSEFPSGTVVPLHRWSPY